MPEYPSDAAVTAWARLLRAQHKAMSAVENALKAAGFPALEWYDALLELERAGAAGLRPAELEHETLLPQYGLSRLIARMEAEGLVARVRLEDDRRGQRVTITVSGLDLRRRMWPVYAAAIQSAIGSRLTETEAETLGALLRKIAE